MKLKTIITVLSVSISLLLYSCNDNQEPKIEEPTVPTKPVADMSEGYNKLLTENKGYALVAEASDEFDDNTLNRDKWLDHHPYWNGRGSKFTPSNISVSSGKLQLKSSIISESQLQLLYNKIDEYLTGVPKNVDIDKWSPNNYGTNWNSTTLNTNINTLMSLGENAIGAACVATKTSCIKEGYYIEARVKASKIGLSSAYWFQGKSSEFDVNENFGAPSYITDFTNKLPFESVTTTHLFANGTWNKQTNVIATLSKSCSSVYLVYGLLWKADKIEVYINDVKRSELLITAAYKDDKYMYFDTEVLNGPWVGWPTKAELINPNLNVFYVDWVRCWKPI